jgi:hypothetical protein
MAGLSLNTARGRLIHDTAARLLAGVADPDNPLVIADCIALAELRVRGDELRRDPASDPNVTIKLEGLIDRRMRRLGLDKQRKPAGPDLRAQFRAAYGLRASEGTRGRGRNANKTAAATREGRHRQRNRRCHRDVGTACAWRRGGRPMTTDAA